MKKGSKLLAILLTLVLVLSVCGCGGSDESGKQLIGTWALEYDLADLLAGEMEGFEDFSTPLVMTICFEFTEDGKFTMFGEEESFKANFDTWVDEFVTFGTDMMYQEFENSYNLKRQTRSSWSKMARASPITCGTLSWLRWTWMPCCRT